MMEEKKKQQKGVVMGRQRQRNPWWKGGVLWLDQTVGRGLALATGGLYEAEPIQERSGMDIQPIRNNTHSVPVPGGQFGVGRLREKLQRRLRRAEEEAFTQQIEYAKVNYLLKAALQQVSDARLTAMFREAGDVELMNKMVSPSDFTTPEQHEEFLAQIAAYQQNAGQLMDLAEEMILRKFIEHTAGLPSNSFID